MTIRFGKTSIKGDEEWTSKLSPEVPCDKRTELSGCGLVPSNSAPTRKGNVVDDNFLFSNLNACAESKTQFASEFFDVVV
jgi:hypothetical protein